MKLVHSATLLALSASLLSSAGLASGCNNCPTTIPPQCVELELDDRTDYPDNWFGHSTADNSTQSGYNGCPTDTYITEMKAATHQDKIVGLQVQCSDSTSFQVPTTNANNLKSLPVQTPTQTQQTSLKRSSEVQDSDTEGINQLQLYGGKQSGVVGLGTGVGLIELLIGIIIGQPLSCACPSGYALSGFIFYSSWYCTRIKFYCCPKTQSSSTASVTLYSSTAQYSSAGSAGEVVASSTGSPGHETGGIEESSLPTPVMESSTAPSGVTGDPQFVGFMGQQYQVHGMDNTVYNIISSKLFQFNALFTYLSEGECRQGTQCFSHPGNYFGKVGLSIRDKNNNNDKIVKIVLTAGSVSEGMKVQLDSEDVLPSHKQLTLNSNTKLYFPTAFDFYLETAEFSLKFENSDMFLNQQVTISLPLLQKIAAFKGNKGVAIDSLPHGILGQTWKRQQYDNRWIYIEGLLYDYIVADGLDGKSFRYNRF